MVSTGTMVAMGFTLILSAVVPLAAMLVYSIMRKKQGVVAAWFLGAAGFFVTQVIIRIPLLSLCSLSEGFVAFAENNYVIYSILLAFTAALFELVGRYVVAKILSKNLTFTKGFAAGLGHGGIEAMVIVGMTYITNFMYAAMINSGTIDTIIAEVEAAGVDATSIHQLVDSLVNTPSIIFCLAGYERLLTMICHLAMTLIVFHYVAQKQDLKGIGICLIFHTILDSVCGIVNGMTTPYIGSILTQNASYVILYTFLTVVAVASIFIIRKIAKAWKN